MAIFISSEFKHSIYLVLLIFLCFVMFFSIFYQIFEGSAYDFSSYVMFYDIFAHHGLFEKTDIGTPNLSFYEMYPLGALLFFYPIYVLIGEVFLSVQLLYVFLVLSCTILVSILILRKTGQSIYFFQYFLVFLFFILTIQVMLGRITEIQIVMFALLFFLSSRKERVFLIPLMCFTNLTVAIPFSILCSYIAIREKNFLIIPALFISAFSVTPFLHSLSYLNIASTLTRYVEGGLILAYLIPPVLLIFSRNHFLTFFSVVFLSIVLVFSAPYGILGLELVPSIPIANTIFLCTWSSFFAFLCVLWLPKDRNLFIFIIFAVLVLVILYGANSKDSEVYLFNALSGINVTRPIFFFVNDYDVISIESRLSSTAYLNGYDISITPMYWFADKHYVSEISENFNSQICRPLGFVNSQGFSNAVFKVSWESSFPNYLHKCNIPYKLIVYNYTLGNASFFITDLKSFGLS